MIEKLQPLQLSSIVYKKWFGWSSSYNAKNLYQTCIVTIQESLQKIGPHISNVLKGMSNKLTTLWMDPSGSMVKKTNMLAFR